MLADRDRANPKCLKLTSRGRKARRRQRWWNGERKRDARDRVETRDGRDGWKGAVAVTTAKRPLAGPSPDIRIGVVHKPSHLIVFDRPGGAKEAFMPLDRRGFIIRAPSP